MGFMPPHWPPLALGLIGGGHMGVEKRLARFAIFATSIAALLTLAAILAEEKTYIKIQPSLFSGLLPRFCLSVGCAGAP